MRPLRAARVTKIFSKGARSELLGPRRKNMQLGNRARSFFDRVRGQKDDFLTRRFSRPGFENLSVHCLGRPRARMGNPNTGIAETLVQDVYDIYFIAAGTASGTLILFTQPLNSAYANFGVTSFNKTYNHTNLTQQGQLASSYTFILRAISIMIHGLQGSAHPYLHPEDAQNFLMTYCELDVNDKPWLRLNAAWAPSAGGLFGPSGVGTLTAPASATQSTNGLPYAKNAYAIYGGLFILPQENFAFVIDPTKSAGGAWSTLAAAGNPTGVPAAGISAWVRFLGQLTRVA